MIRQSLSWTFILKGINIKDGRKCWLVKVHLKRKMTGHHYLLEYNWWYIINHIVEDWVTGGGCWPGQASFLIYVLSSYSSLTLVNQGRSEERMWSLKQRATIGRRAGSHSPDNKLPGRGDTKLRPVLINYYYTFSLFLI